MHLYAMTVRRKIKTGEWAQNCKAGVYLNCPSTQTVGGKNPGDEKEIYITDQRKTLSTIQKVDEVDNEIVRSKFYRA